MKKLISKIISAVLVVALMLSLTACNKKVEDGSVIVDVKLTVAFYDENGEATEYEIFAKLYENFAPQTIAKIVSKIQNGDYNGTCISNVKSSYAQFGDYTLNADGSLTAKDQGGYIKGEFYKTGWAGNTLTANPGALVLLHDDKAGKDANGNVVSKYDTAKGAIAISFSASSFDAESYCVFGKLCDDDGNADSDDEMLKKSSYGKMYTLVNRIAEENGRRVYYCVSDDTVATPDDEVLADGEPREYNWANKYFTYLSYDEDMTYVEGIFASEADAKAAGKAPLTDEQVADLQEKMSENPNNFYNVPVMSVVIKTVEIVK